METVIHLFEIEIFCHIIKAFTVTFAQCNASLLNKSINFLQLLTVVYTHINSLMTASSNHHLEQEAFSTREEENRSHYSTRAPLGIQRSHGYKETIHGGLIGEKKLITQVSLGGFM